MLELDESFWHQIATMQTADFWSWLISRSFASFQASLTGIQQHDLLLKMRFAVLKLQFLLHKWIQDLLLPL